VPASPRCSPGQEERNLAAETIYRFVFGSLYRLGRFNGDPHPGNYLFRPGGRVTFLDFGLVKHFTDDEIDFFGRMIQAIVLDRDPRFRRTVEASGSWPPARRSPTPRSIDYFTPLLRVRPATTGRSPSPRSTPSETVRRIFDASGPYGRS
jgi:predicted unusual protein kinase regulating ubiquinone biosynthesis (AarF/ABC1/UbiB family)